MNEETNQILNKMLTLGLFFNHLHINLDAPFFKQNVFDNRKDVIEHKIVQIDVCFEF